MSTVPPPTCKDVDQLKEAIGILRRDAVSLRGEVAVLRESLAVSGILSETQFHVQLHRHRFAAARLAHHWSSCICLADVLGTCELASAVGLAMGPAAAHVACPTSRSVCRALERMWPGSICVFGGFDGETELRTAERFIPITNAWEPMPAMQHLRANAAASVLAGTIYVCGGSDGRQQLSSVERFDPLAGGHSQGRHSSLPPGRSCGGSWEQLPPMSVARSHAAAASVAGKLYVCGGISNSWNPALVEALSSAERFVPQDGCWELLPPMATARWRLLASAVAPSSPFYKGQLRNGSTNGDPTEKLLVCGGLTDGRGGPEMKVKALGSTELFDPSAGVWQQGISCGRWAPDRAAVALSSGRLFSFGGGQKVYSLGGISSPAALAQCFDPYVGEWRSLPSSPARCNQDAVGISAGKIYICGGTKGMHRQQSAERFDPHTGAWEVLPDMISRRSAAAAVAVGWA